MCGRMICGKPGKCGYVGKLCLTGVKISVAGIRRNLHLALLSETFVSEKRRRRYL